MTAMTSHGPVLQRAAGVAPRVWRCCSDPTLNKGTAFTEPSATRWACAACCRRASSRRRSRLARVLENFRRKPTPLEKYIDLAGLHDRNEALFFRLLIDHPDEMLPIVYTPTVGLACQQYGHIFQRPRGLFVSARRPRPRRARSSPTGRGATSRSSW